MSKMDAVRAMREARYAEAQSRAGRAAKPPAPARAAAPKQAAKQAAQQAPEQDAPPPATTDDELCGHRNMSGRTCTRERGHAAKSHRYA